MGQRIKDLHGEADTAYQSLRAMEPANTQDIIVGYKPSPSGLVKDAIPVIEKMAFPVDLAKAKAALKPIYDRMRRQMPVTQQDASPGLKALQNIMDGPNIAPASIVDLDLSAIKSIARSAAMPELRDLGQGIAAQAVKELDDAVRAAVRQGGPKAEAALQAGRKATVAKYLASEVLDGLRDEPVKAFKQAVTPSDAAINQLRELQKLAPAEIPKVGRAFLDDLFTSAKSEGGFKGGQGMAAKWANLGDETKKILFKDPALRSELDKFFLAAKRLSENPNPSGSGGMVSIMGQGGLLVYNPTLGVATQLSSAALSKILRSPSLVKLLTQGLTSKPQSLTNKLLWASIAPLMGQESE